MKNPSIMMLLPLLLGECFPLCVAPIVCSALLAWPRAGFGGFLWKELWMEWVWARRYILLVSPGPAECPGYRDG
uniref:Putative secreted protein n=1 Tax=Anopheles darlingi TaxID=43151 RepID=A0A2M4DFQ6_ANODA